MPRHTLPSVKALREVFGDKASTARRVLEMSFSELCDTIDGAARVAECFHTPAVHDVRMCVLDGLGKTFGVEALQLSSGQWLEYLNVGDPYHSTLVCYADGRYRVACWGDIVERDERIRT